MVQSIRTCVNTMESIWMFSQTEFEILKGMSPEAEVTLASAHQRRVRQQSPVPFKPVERLFIRRIPAVAFKM